MNRAKAESENGLKGHIFHDSPSKKVKNLVALEKSSR
jgi:hypothetical protein